MDQFGLPAGKSPRFSSTFTGLRKACLSWGLLALVTCGGGHSFHGGTRCPVREAQLKTHVLPVATSSLWPRLEVADLLGDLGTK